MPSQSRQVATAPAAAVWYKNPLLWVAVVAVLAMIGHFGPPADSSASVAPTPEITVEPTPITIESQDELQPLSQDGFCSGDNNIIVIGDVENLPPILSNSAPSPSDKATDECEEERQAHRARIQRWYAGDFRIVRN